ncbi:MAG: STAS domain-containing protein [Ilumatobacteraceae bacterium]
MELICSLTELGGLPVLQVSGEIDLATLPYFRDQLTRAISMRPGATLFVDLDGVTALDDTGLGMLLGGAGRAREQAGDLTIVCTSERLRARFTSTGLDRAVTVVGRLALPLDRP